MSFVKNSAKSAWMGGAALTIGFATLPASANAQMLPADQDAGLQGPDAASAPANKTQSGTADGTIVVTASRIDRAFLAPTPTVSVSAEQLSIGAPSNVADALSDLPQFRLTGGPQVTSTNFNAGSAPVDLRGLGINRTLVLLNGRRISSDNDLNTIPPILIKSVDIVTGGASAAWGSGAVAGVVNLSIDGELTGFKADFGAGVSSRGDNGTRHLQAAYGQGFAGDRGHFVIGGDFFDSDGIAPRTARANAGRWASVSNGAGAFMLSPNVGLANAALGGLIFSGPLKGQAFNPDGSLRAFSSTGTVIGTSLISSAASSFDDVSPLVAPTRHYSVLARLSYDLTPDLKVTGEIRHSRFYNSYDAFPDNSLGLTISTSNAYLPSAVRSQLVAAGVTSFTFGRVNSDFALEHFRVSRPVTQGTVALDGELGSRWRYSAYYSHGVAVNDFAISNQIIKQNFAQAVDAVIGPNGQPVCRVALTNTASTCVPINLFGNGNVSAAAQAYVTGTPTLHARQTLDVGGASFRGEPLTLPAGDVSVALGIDARREGINQSADALSRASAFTGNNAAPLVGHYTVKEAFGEVLIPVIKDVPLLEHLEVNAAARLSDYSTTGSIWSWKIGATDKLFKGLRARFTLSRDIRSANLTELFTVRTQGLTSVSDPVTGRTFTNIPINNGGNPNLQPETSKTMTAGLIWSPTFIPRLIFSVDYYNIKIDNVIVQPLAQDIVTRCATTSAPVCAGITRDASQNITQINTTFSNFQKYKNDGVDADITYSLPEDRFGGRLIFRGIISWVNSLTISNGLTTVDYVKSQNAAFSFGVPKTRVTANILYDGAAFGGYARLRYISAGNTNNAVNNVNGHIPAFAYIDVGAKAKVRIGGEDRFELYFDVTNLLDKDPPPASNFSPFYDVVGRYLSAGVRLRL